jgi:N6-adenosine-specific RNA methylase IME4
MSTAMSTDLTTLPQQNPQTVGEWADVISLCWRSTVECIMMTGRKLTEAKLSLRHHGEWLELVDKKLHFGERMAQQLMRIGNDARLASPNICSRLPTEWTTIREISRLEDADLATALTSGIINPNMKAADLSVPRKQKERAAWERDLAAMQAKAGHYGVILDDFEWDFQVWGKRSEKHPSSHYETATDAHTPEEIVARTAERFKAAAPDCVHFMWCSAPYLAIALKVVELRGFQYVTHLVWPKNTLTTGYWVRGRHELLLINKRGKVRAPAPGMQFDSVLEGVVRDHSQKPDSQYELIEAMFPTLPKIEFNARQRRPGWDAWGNEVPLAASVAA